MLTPNNVKVDALATVGSKLLLTDVTPKYEYVNGKRTEKIVAYGYTVVMPERAFEKISVRIDGKQLIEKPPDGYVEVQFDSLELYLYWSQGDYHIGARAGGIHAIVNKA